MTSDPKDIMAKCTLESLPNEILDDVSQVLAETSMESVRSLRLVSRRFAEIAIKHIFGTLVLRQHPQEWENLNKIAQVPALAAVVKTIKVVQVPRPMKKQSSEGWCKTLKSSVRGWSAPFDLSTVGKTGKDDEYWMAGYYTVLSWYDRFRRGEAISHIMPEMRIDKFTRLTTLETIGCRTLDERTAQAFEPYPSSLVGIESAAFYEHFQLFLAAAKLNGMVIPILKLHDVGDLVGDPLLDWSSLNTRGIKSLRLNFGGETWHNFTWFQNTSRSSPTDMFATWWLLSMTAVEELTIIQDPYNSIGFDPLELLDIVHFPQLRSLRLHEVTMQRHDLQRFLNAHHDTLRSITIKDPGMCHKAWRKVRKDMLEKQNDDSLSRDQTKLDLTGHSKHCLHCHRLLPTSPLHRPTEGRDILFSIGNCSEHHSEDDPGDDSDDDSERKNAEAT